MSEQRYLIRYSGAGSLVMVILVFLNLQVVSFIPSERIEVLTSLSSALVVLFGALSSGFFFSQVYWLYFTWYEKGYLGRCLRPQFRYFATKFNIGEKKRKELETRFDYFFHRRGNSELLSYTARRWNLYHALGTISFTLVLSIVLSIIIGVFLPFLFPRLFENVQYYSYILNYFDVSFWVRLIIIGILSFVFVIYSFFQRKKLEEEINEIEKLWVEDLKHDNDHKNADRENV